MQKKNSIFLPKIIFIDKQIMKEERERDPQNFTLCSHLEWNTGIIFHIPQNNVSNYLHSLFIFRPYSTDTLYRKHQQLERNSKESLEFTYVQTQSMLCDQ